MLTLNGKKMSKSTGNSVLASEIFDGNNNIFSKSFSPMTLKFFMYQAHYRNTLDLSNEALLASEKAFEKVVQLKKDIDNLETSDISNISSQDWVDKCYKSLNDDFNSPKLIANFFDLTKIVNEIKSGKKKIDLENKNLLINYFNVFSTDILGLNFESEKNDNQNQILDLLIEIRDKERENKNYIISDFIRDKLNTLGINIEDKK
jgi:cysteinyl-tRNA synthetase